MTWVSDHVDLLVSTSRTHLWLALVPVVLGLVISIPLGWLAYRWKAVRVVLVPAVGLLYTIPSIALFVVMPLILGSRILDPINVQAALTIYTVALLVRAVADALAAVPQVVIAAANAMGFRAVHRFFAVELPLAVPVLIANLRVATVSNISLVAVGALIGVGGLGSLFTDGFPLRNYSEIVAAIVLIMVLALLADALLLLVGRVLTPWTRSRRA